jgi:hypothetical protein
MFGVNVNRVSHDGTLRTGRNRTSPDTKLDCFPLQDQTEAETVAFGYRARALVFEQRVRRPLAIRDMRRFVTAGDGLAITIPR